MTPAALANYAGARAVAEAEAYLAGRISRAELDGAVQRAMLEVFMLPAIGDALSDAVRLLVVTMINASRASGEREQRWRDLMAAFCRHVRFEAGELTRDRT